MTHLTIEVPDVIADYLEMQVAAGHSSSVSEFVRVLRVHCEREAIEQKVLAADMANDATEVTPDFWDALRARVGAKTCARFQQTV